MKNKNWSYNSSPLYVILGMMLRYLSGGHLYRQTVVPAANTQRRAQLWHHYVDSYLSCNAQSTYRFSGVVKQLACLPPGDVGGRSRPRRLTGHFVFAGGTQRLVLPQKMDVQRVHCNTNRSELWWRHDHTTSRVHLFITTSQSSGHVSSVLVPFTSHHF